LRDFQSSNTKSYFGKANASNIKEQITMTLSLSINPLKMCRFGALSKTEPKGVLEPHTRFVHGGLDFFATQQHLEMLQGAANDVTRSFSSQKELLSSDGPLPTEVQQQALSALTDLKQKFALECVQHDIKLALYGDAANKAKLSQPIYFLIQGTGDPKDEKLIDAAIKRLKQMGYTDHSAAVALAFFANSDTK
jgi:hypothetical protein